ncbi:MAG TPA: type VI secretion system contractile sheath large subunit, partial [Pyrinomonadaceae bacterium]|nr:type VI secretion system contractile sheath large subunit [Pyrinomonadaceae bacterium]
MPITDENLESMFTFGAETGGVVDQPPFRVLILGDWSGDSEKRDLADRRLLEIDRDNFDEAIRKMGASVNLALGDGQEINLRFEELDDFHPDRIFEQVGLFNELRDLRKRLKDPNEFNAAANDVRSWIGSKSEVQPEPQTAPAVAAAEPVETAESGDLLSQILTQPSGSAAVARVKGSDEINSLLREIVTPHVIRIDENEQSQMIAAVDHATSDVMRKILHDHKFQALEAAWRGLYFLVRGTDTSPDLKLYILNVSKDELINSLKSAESLSETPLYKTLVRDTVETPGAEPWAVVVGNYAFLPEKDDVAALIRISRLAQAAYAPFVSHMRPEVLGVHTLEGNTDPKDWNLSADTDAGKLWATLRGLDESRFLGLTIPRFLARLPYGADTDPLERFSFEEFEAKPAHDLYLWANSALACALLLAQSYAEYGWEMGDSLMQDIDGLP